MWLDGIEVDASDWLRHIVLTKAHTVSTAKQYAKVLRAFLRYCKRLKRNWKHVDDLFLEQWRNSRRKPESSKGLILVNPGIYYVNDQTVVYDLSIIFNFYAWSEEKGRLRYRVGTYDPDSMPFGMKPSSFPITARRKKNLKGRELGEWVSPLVFPVSSNNFGRRNTPNDRQVPRIHRELLKTAQGERDALIASWAEETGARRAEILQVPCSAIPSKKEINKLIDDEENLEIVISHRKRGSTTPLSANPYLLMMTREWIDGARATMVRKYRQKEPGYREPREIFISDRTGQVLHPDSVTKLMGTAFFAAGVKKASLHRLRAKAIVEVIETVVASFEELGVVVEPNKQWAETILHMVAEQSGHGSPGSLKPYLNFVLSRRLSQTEAAKQKRSAERTRDFERRASRAMAIMKMSNEIENVIRLSGNGQTVEAEAALKRAISAMHVTGAA